jgi:hypothetical protein
MESLDQSSLHPERDMSRLGLGSEVRYLCRYQPVNVRNEKLPTRKL